MNQKTLFSPPSSVKSLSSAVVAFSQDGGWCELRRIRYLGLVFLCCIAFINEIHAQKRPYCSRGRTHIGCIQVDEDGCCLKGIGQKTCEVGSHRLNCRKKDQNEIGCCPDTPRQEKQRKDEVDWVFVEGGKFKMGAIWGEGDDDELPQHWVKIESLYISKNEITVRQYARCVKMGVCSLPQQGGCLLYTSPSPRD